MDDATKKIITAAYDDTVTEALGRGLAAETAHSEGIAAAAMFLSSLAGLEVATARAKVEGLGLRPE